MKLPLILAGGLLALAACAGKDDEPVKIIDVGDKQSRCELYRGALAYGESQGVNSITIPALNQTLSVAELRVLVESGCASEPTS